MRAKINFISWSVFLLLVTHMTNENKQMTKMEKVKTIKNPTERIIARRHIERDLKRYN